MRVLETRRIYEGKVINVRVDEVDSGKHRTKNEVVEHSGAVVLIARPDPRSIILVRQYRHPTGRTLLEAPAGGIESGETPEAAAERELREETGFAAKRMQRLWSAYSAPGFCDELLHFFAADDLTAGDVDPQDGEEIDMEILAIEDAWAMVERDELPDAKTQIALAWARSQIG